MAIGLVLSKTGDFVKPEVNVFRVLSRRASRASVPPQSFVYLDS